MGEMIIADEATLDDLDLSATTAKILEGHGYRTIGQLRRATDAELLSLAGIGAVRLQQIRAITGRCKDG